MFISGWLAARRKEKRNYLWNYHIITTSWENRILIIKIWSTHSSFLLKNISNIETYKWNEILNIQIPSTQLCQICRFCQRLLWSAEVIIAFWQTTSQKDLKSLCPFSWSHAPPAAFLLLEVTRSWIWVYESSMCFYSMIIYISISSIKL